MGWYQRRVHGDREFQSSSRSKMQSLVPLLLVGVFLASGTAQSSKFSIRNMIPDFLVAGQCPKVDEKALWAQQVPNHPKYAGRWYETFRSDNDFQLVKGCAKSDLTYDGPGAGFRQITTGVDNNDNPIRRDGVIFPFTTGANSETPHLSIQFDEPSFPAPYVILDTDYDNYACIYSCTDFNGNFMTDFLFAWSRHPTIGHEYHKCIQAFTKIGVNPMRLKQMKLGPLCDNEYIDSLLL